MLGIYVFLFFQDSCPGKIKIHLQIGAVFLVGQARPRTQHNYHHDTDFYISNLRVKLICYLYLPTQNICLHRQVFKHYRIFPKISKANTVEELNFHLPVPETHNKASSTYRTEY